jgi:glycosyltransferase involved in cell wall biosynthesis
MANQRNPLRYLLVTHIPFARKSNGDIVIDGLWARDLEGIAQSGWQLQVCGPELKNESAIQTWGPSAATLPSDGAIGFTGFPSVARRTDLWKWPIIRSVLAKEVRQADIVHSSNLFAPYVPLSYAHDLAARLGKKTVFVIAEDFHDMLEWEFVRLGSSAREIERRRQKLAVLDERVRRSAATASLTFLHTPAAVTRYRMAARNGVAIRQPGHEASDVISREDLHEKCRRLESGEPLTLIAACRHKWLKGLDLLIWAIHRLAERGLRVQARLYGGGEQNAELKQLTARLGLDEQISFPGYLAPGPEVYAAIAAGNVFAMPHRTTDFGRAFYDAMAGGTPVLAFRTEASAETVRHEVDGLLSPLDDIEGLAAGIQRLHCDRQLLIRCARAARDRALANTRSSWYQLRADLTHSLFQEAKRHG